MRFCYEIDGVSDSPAILNVHMTESTQKSIVNQTYPGCSKN